MAGRGQRRLENITKDDNWPQDLLLPILSTLPSKSLSRFKCVSKHWKSLLISPDFIEHHLRNQQRKAYPQFVFASIESETDIILESVAIVDVQRGEAEKEKDGVKRTRKGFQRSTLNICHLPPDFYSMSNPCDGVLCFFGNTNIFVYNPGTREFRFLQIGNEGSSLVRSFSSSDCFGQVFSTSHLVGFGRDQVTKECKIIRLFTSKEEDENNIQECEVLTLNSDPTASWRSIGKVAYLIGPSQKPVYLNGALHWMLDQRHSNPSEVIVSFDLHTEKFQAISHPSCCSDASNHHMRRFLGLLSLRNSLCLAEPEQGLQLNIWIMNQCDGIWEKLLNIDWELMTYRCPLAFPMVELKDGTFFVSHCGDHLQIYYPEKKSFSGVLLQHKRRSVVPTVYFESLVPLYGEPLVY